MRWPYDPACPRAIRSQGTRAMQTNRPHAQARPSRIEIAPATRLLSESIKSTGFQQLVQALIEKVASGCGHRSSFDPDRVLFFPLPALAQRHAFIVPSFPLLAVRGGTRRGAIRRRKRLLYNHGSIVCAARKTGLWACLEFRPGLLCQVITRVPRQTAGHRRRACGSKRSSPVPSGGTRQRSGNRRARRLMRSNRP